MKLKKNLYALALFSCVFSSEKNLALENDNDVVFLESVIICEGKNEDDFQREIPSVCLEAKSYNFGFMQKDVFINKDNEMVKLIGPVCSYEMNLCNSLHIKAKAGMMFNSSLSTIVKDYDKASNVGFDASVFIGKPICTTCTGEGGNVLLTGLFMQYENYSFEFDGITGVNCRNEYKKGSLGSQIGAFNCCSDRLGYSIFTRFGFVIRKEELVGTATDGKYLTPEVSNNLKNGVMSNNITYPKTEVSMDNSNSVDSKTSDYKISDKKIEEETSSKMPISEGSKNDSYLVAVSFGGDVSFSIGDSGVRVLLGYQTDIYFPVKETSCVSCIKGNFLKNLGHTVSIQLQYYM